VLKWLRIEPMGRLFLTLSLFHAVTDRTVRANMSRSMNFFGRVRHLWEELHQDRKMKFTDGMCGEPLLAETKFCSFVLGLRYGLFIICFILQNTLDCFAFRRYVRRGSRRDGNVKLPLYLPTYNVTKT
jgi:hypothetical protein